MSVHNREITDPVEEMLKKTGCIELHYKVQVTYQDSPQSNVTNLTNFF